MRLGFLLFILLAGCASPSPDVCPACGHKVTAEREARAPKSKGFVYIIESPKSFGRGVYKIGMTQRTNPQKRISELGDASVPFPFKPVIILQTDSPRELEAFFHHALDTARLNKNREFFRLTKKEMTRVLSDAQARYPLKRCKL